MPDKIKDAFDALKDTEMFVDEADFRNQVSKDPKGVFSLFDEDKNTKGVFIDYNDFETQLGLKKKQNSQPSSDGVSESASSTAKPLEFGYKTPLDVPAQPKNKTPIAPKVITKQAVTDLQKQLGDINPIGRINLYTQSLGSVEQRFNKNLDLYNQAKGAGDTESMAQLEPLLKQDGLAAQRLKSGIEGQKKLAQIKEPNTVANTLGIGLETAWGHILSAPQDFDKATDILVSEGLEALGLGGKKMLADVNKFKEKANEKGMPSPWAASEFLAKKGVELVKDSETRSQEKRANLPYGGSGWEAIKDGDVSKGVEYGSKAFLESLPTSATFLNPYTAAATMSGMVGDEMRDAEAEGNDVNSTIILAGTIKAGLELATERMFGAGRATKDLLETLGKEGVKSLTEEMVKKSLKRKLGETYVEEVAGELANQVGSNAADKYILGKDVSLTDGVGEAGWTALFGAGIQGTAPVVLKHVIDKKRTAEAQEKKEAAGQMMNDATSQNDPNVSEAIEVKAQQLNDEADAIITQQNEVAENVSPETLSQITDINSRIESIDVALNSDMSEVSKEALEEEKKSLEIEQEKLAEIATNEAKENIENAVEIEPIPGEKEGETNILDQPATSDTEGSQVQKEGEEAVVQDAPSNVEEGGVGVGGDVEAKKDEIKKIQNEIDSFDNEYNSLVDIVNKEDRRLNTPKSENETKLNKLQDKISALIDKRDKLEQSIKETPKAEAGSGVGRGKNYISVFHGGKVSELSMANNNLFVTEDKNQAEAYAKGNGGKVQEFKIDRNEITDENEVRKIIVDLGLQSKEEGWDLSTELMLHEILDPVFSTSLSDTDLKTLYKELSKKGYKAIEMNATDITGSKRNINDIMVLNPKESLSKVNPNIYFIIEKEVDGVVFGIAKENNGKFGLYVNGIKQSEHKIISDAKKAVEQSLKEQPKSEVKESAPTETKTSVSFQPEGESKLNVPLTDKRNNSETIEDTGVPETENAEERKRKVEILDTEKKIAQLEKEMRNAPIKPSRGIPSKKQLRIQMRNYKDQLSELKGLPPRKKVTDSVLRINLRKFGTEVDNANLSHEERVVLDAIGTLSATDPDILNSDGNATLRKQGALKAKGGASIDQIVTDYINENELDDSMASDLRNSIISFVSKGDAYGWMNTIKEREAQLDPDAIRESDYYNYGYEQAIENEMTDEEISELENEIGQLNDLTEEEYEELKQKFTESDTEPGEGSDQAESAADSEKEESQQEKSLADLAKETVSDVRKEYSDKLKEAEQDLRNAQERLDKERAALKAKGIPDTKIAIKLAPYEKGVKDYTTKYQKALKAQENVRKFEEAQGDIFKGPQGGFASTGKKTTIDDLVRGKTTKAEAFNFHQRVKKILEKIGVPVAEKNLSKKFLGIFKHRSKNVRLQSLFDFVTATHETAHYVSREFGLGAQIFQKAAVDVTNKDAALNKSLRKALTDIYTEFYPGAKKTHGLEKRVEEGIAVLLERYLVDPTDISNRYKVLVDNFINPLGKYYHPKFTELLDEMNSLISDYSDLTDEEKIGSRIARGEEVITKDEGFQLAQRAAFEMIYIGMPLRMADQMTDAGLTNESAEVAHFRWLDRQTVISNWINGKDHAMTIAGDGDWKAVGASVSEYLKLIDGREAEFDAFLVSRRALGDIDYLTKLQNELDTFLADIDEDTELDKEQMEYVDELKTKIQRQQEIIEKDKFDVQTITNVVEKYAADKKFQEAAKIFDKLNNAVVDFAESTGLITPEQSSSYKENKTYASFQRLVYDDLAQISATGTRSQAKVSAFLGRKGSDLQILSPIYSQVLMINETISKGLQNQIWQRLAALGDKNVEIARRFELMETKRVIDKETGQISYPQDSQKDLIKVWNNGQRAYYKPAPEVVAFAETMSPQQFEFFAYALRYASGIFSRLTTTANPLFPLVNIPVDTISAWINTKTGFKPVYDQVRTLKDMAEYSVQYLTHLETVSKWFDKVRKTPMKDLQKEDLKMFEKYLALGGKSQTQSAYYDLTPEELIAKTKGGTIARKVLQTIDDYTLGLLEMPSNMSEYMTRFAEFKRAKEQGYSDDVAMYMASQVSVPFQQSGRFGGRFGVTYVKSIPYFNATLQVAAKFLKTANEDPVRVGAIATSLFATSVAMAVASMKFADDDDKRILMEQGPEELSKYIYIPNAIFGGKGFSRLRIPEQVGMITGPAYMYVLDTYGKVKYDMSDYIDASTVAVPSQFNLTKPGQIPFTWLPQILKPAVEVTAGIQSYPEVRPIVPIGLEHKLPEYQYTQYTSESAKFAGKMLKISPIKIDHYIKAQFGAVPSMLLNEAESAVTGKEPRTKSRLNIQEKNFVLRGKSYNDFYQNFNYWSKKNASVKDIQEEEVLTKKEVKDIKANYKAFSTMKKNLSEMRDYVKTKELPEDIKQLAFEALLELNNAENPYTANDKLELLKSKVNKLK